MVCRPGYDELVAERGRAIANEIVADAERYSDAAHQGWDVALRWAIDRYDRPADPALTAQQNENARLADDVLRRRGDDGRRILYLANELAATAYDLPACLARAETVHDAEGWRLPAGAQMRDELDWAKSRARAMLDATREGQLAQQRSLLQAEQQLEGLLSVLANDLETRV